MWLPLFYRLWKYLVRICDLYWDNFFVHTLSLQIKDNKCLVSKGFFFKKNKQWEVNGVKREVSVEVKGGKET